MDALRHLGLLRHFLVVARTGSITAAAEELRLSQPALTKSIRRLEAECGAELFDRHRRGVSLTKYGMALFRHARIIEAECRFAAAEVEALRQGYRGNLRIGSGPFWGATILPRAIVRLHERFPNLNINLQVDVNAVTHPLLYDGELDLVVSAAPDLGTLPSHTAFRQMNVIRHRVFARNGHPLFRQPKIHPIDLSKFAWVVYQQDPEIIAHLMSTLSALGSDQPPTIAIETNSLLTILEMLRSSNFVACLAAPLFELLNEFGVREVPLEAEISSIPAGMLYHKALETSAPVTALWSILEDQIADVRQPSAQTSHVLLA